MVYTSSEPGFISFNSNADATIYMKSAGENKDVWYATINGKSGFVNSKFLRENKIYVKKANLIITDVKENIAQVQPEKVQQQYEVIDGTTIYTTNSESTTHQGDIENNLEYIQNEENMGTTPTLQEWPQDTHLQIESTTAPPIDINDLEETNDQNVIFNKQSSSALIQETLNENVQENNQQPEKQNYISDNKNSEQNNELRQGIVNSHIENEGDINVLPPLEQIPNNHPQDLKIIPEQQFPPIIHQNYMPPIDQQQKMTPEQYMPHEQVPFISPQEQPLPHAQNQHTLPNILNENLLSNNAPEQTPVVIPESVTMINQDHMSITTEKQITPNDQTINMAPDSGPSSETSTVLHADIPIISQDAITTSNHNPNLPGLTVPDNIDFLNKNFEQPNTNDKNYEQNSSAASLKDDNSGNKIIDNSDMHVSSDEVSGGTLASDNTDKNNQEHLENGSLQPIFTDALEQSRSSLNIEETSENILHTPDTTIPNREGTLNDNEKLEPVPEQNLKQPESYQVIQENPQFLSDNILSETPENILNRESDHNSKDTIEDNERISSLPSDTTTPSPSSIFNEPTDDNNNNNGIFSTLYTTVAEFWPTTTESSLNDMSTESTIFTTSTETQDTVDNLELTSDTEHEGFSFVKFLTSTYKSMMSSKVDSRALFATAGLYFVSGLFVIIFFFKKNPAYVNERKK